MTFEFFIKNMLWVFSFSMCLSMVSATNITYEDIAPVNFTELQQVLTTVPGLNHLFTMATNFVNTVFQPFSVIEEFIFSLADPNGSGNTDLINNLLSSWQALASFEVGFVTCFVAGCLFIVLVPLVGMIMCCCRTCCSNCGGEMEQSLKRAKSGWRQCMTVGLFICSVFIAVPCVFVYLTNVWASTALQEIPSVTQSALDDLRNYIVDVPGQLSHVVGEFSKLDESLREDVNSIGTRIGDPIRQEFLTLTSPTIDRLTDLSNLTQETLSALQNVQTYTTELSTGMSGMNTALQNEKTSLDNDLNNALCTNNQFCRIVQGSTAALNPTGADFSSLDGIQNEITNLNNTLNQHDIDGQADAILDNINTIPEMVTNASSEASGQILDFLDEINSTLVSQVQELPLDTITSLDETLASIGSSVNSFLNDYNTNYDSYRYAAGAALASMIAIIVAFYWLGLFCGTVSYSPYPSERSACSNCGGIMIMAGVGFTFIFSWLLMILVVIFFTIGGHTEKYICQNFESPYEGLKFADRILAFYPIEVNNRSVSLSLYTAITECERNASIYNAAGIAQIFNITELLENSTAMIEPFREQLENFSLNLSDINTYPPELEAALESIKTTGFDSINFTSYIDQINLGLTSTNLLNYAQFLNDSADNMTTIPPNPSQALQDLANTIRGHSYEITQIQANDVDPLSGTLSSLNDSVRELENTASDFNTTVDNLATALQDLNTDLSNNASDIVKNVVVEFADGIIADATGYMNYLVEQITERFGACRPLFLVYSKMTAVLCSYLIEIINGFWFSMGWCIAFLIPAAILALKLSKFFRVMVELGDKGDAHWDDMEMESMHNTNNNNKRLPSAKIRTPETAVVKDQDVLSRVSGDRESASLHKSGPTVGSNLQPSLGDGRESAQTGRDSSLSAQLGQIETPRPESEIARLHKSAPERRSSVELPPTRASNSAVGNDTEEIYDRWTRSSKIHPAPSPDHYY